MKLTAIFLTVICLQVSAGSLAQVTFSGKEVALEKVFDAIKRQTNFTVFYDTYDLRDARKVTVTVKDVSVQTILDKCLADQPLEYKISGNSIFISRKKEEKVNNENVINSTQSIPPARISGKVVNQNNDPVQGATVTEKGTKNATSTLNDGSFALTVENPSGILVITGANIDPYDFKLKAGQSMVFASVNMKISKLDEIQVVAYGTNTQRYQVGSVTKITAEEIASQPVSNPLAALQGRAPGLVITNTNGVPGAGLKVQVRGQNTLKPIGGTGSLPPLDQPLFIVDGIPFAPQNANLNQLNSVVGPYPDQNPYGGISPFNMISPAEIESIEILRDADATSIYGSRGSNGVILITTKRGKAGKTKINVRGYSGFSSVTRTMRMLNTQEYLSMRREAFKNNNVQPTTTNAPDLLLFDTTRYTDWKEYFLGNTAKTQDINASVSGGTNNTKFLIGANYHKEGYVLPGDLSDNRVTINASLTHTSADNKFAVTFSNIFSSDVNNSVGAINALQGFRLIPNYPSLLNEDGSLAWVYKGVNLNNPANPLQYFKQKYEINTENLISNLRLSYTLFPGLQLSSSFGYNYLISSENSQFPKSAQQPRPNISGSSTFGENKYKLWIIEPLIEYKRVFQRSNISIVIGSTVQQTTNSRNSITGSNYSDDALLESLGPAGSVGGYSSAYSKYKYAAGFGRLSFVHANRYIANISGRRDGSSRFGPGKRFGTFGSVGVGWIFSEESFVKNGLPFLSFGKIRSSYGTTGSDAISDYLYQPTWALTSLSYQGVRGYTPQNLFNPDLSWAVTKKLETALEFGLFRDRIVGSVIWFRNRCANQLISYILPGQTGFSNVTQNFAATVENTGLEFQMSSTFIKSKKFSWTSSFNFTLPKNKLVAFPGIESSSYSNVYVIGKSLSVLQKVKYAGVNDSTGIFQFFTKENKVTYDPDIIKDVNVIGNLDPKYYGGLLNSFKYGQLSFDFFIEFRKQLGANFLHYVYSGADVGTRTNNIPAELLDRWQAPGDKAVYQKFSQNNRDTRRAAVIFANASDAAYSDASYIRLKTVNVSFDFAQTISPRKKIEQMKLFLSAQNLLTITHYKGTDPESQSFDGVPLLKTIVVGVQVGF